MDPEIEVPEAPADLTDRDTFGDDALTEYEANLLAAFDALHDSGSKDVALLARIAEQVAAARSERERREAADAETEAQIAALAEAVRGPVAAETDPEGGEGGEGGDDDGNGGDDPDAVTDPVAEPAAETVETAPAPEPVAAAATPTRPSPTRRASASGVRRNAGTTRAPAAASTPTNAIVLTAAADLPGHSTGSVLTLTDVAQGLHDKARVLVDDGHPVPVSRIVLPYDESRTLDARQPMDRNLAILDEITNPARSLTAAGWCTPSENMYELFALDGADGLLDLPTVRIARGGINVPGFIGYGDAAGALWSWTETLDELTAKQIVSGTVVGGLLTVNTGTAHGLTSGQTIRISGGVAAGTWGPITVTDADTFTVAGTGLEDVADIGTGLVQVVKGCLTIPCPTFTDYRLEAEGVCLTHGNLSDTAYPELTARFVQLTLNSHLHRLSAAQINKIVTDAGAAVDMTEVSDTPGDVLSALELTARDIRSRWRAARTSVIEVIAPDWITGAMRASFAMRAGVELTNVTDDMVAAHFATRGIRVQYVADWQPLWSGAAKQAWPTSAEFLVYPAGSYFGGDGGSIDLGVVRDSTLNQTNDFTAAWSEQFYLVGRRGPAARRIAVALDTTGVTACCA